MYVNFSSSALSTHTVEVFENNRNICEKLICDFILNVKKIDCNSKISEIEDKNSRYQQFCEKQNQLTLEKSEIPDATQILKKSEVDGKISTEIYEIPNLDLGGLYDVDYKKDVPNTLKEMHDHGSIQICIIGNQNSLYLFPTPFAFFCQLSV